MIYYNHINISREAKIIILKRRYSIRSLQNLTHEKVQCCCFWKAGSESLQQQGFILDCFLVIIKTYSPVFVHVHLLQGEVDDILGNTINIYGCRLPPPWPHPRPPPPGPGAWGTSAAASSSPPWRWSPCRSGRTRRSSTGSAPGNTWLGAEEILNAHDQHTESRIIAH